jgi:competence ComEA-like helix-hairpin-helix protein
MNSTQYSICPAFSQAIVLRGQLGYHINENRVLINVEEIANDRDESNTSGSLTLELWALEHPYQGGGFTGYNLASISLGQIQGQYCLRNQQFDLTFQQPPEGEWHLVLMLREWEQGAFITRDFTNFTFKHHVEKIKPVARPEVTRQDGTNIIEVAFRDTKTGKQTKASGKKAAPKTTAPQTPVAGSTSKEKTLSKTTLTSINKAKIGELAALNGVSLKLAQAIVDGRPYKKLQDLLEVKGMGKKIFEKLESTLSL